MSRLLIFADCETTAITPLGVHDGRGEVWELALITRDLDDPGRGDEEWAWQIRPSATEHGDAGSFKVGGYYERNSARKLPPGMARRIAEPAGEESDRAAIGVSHVASFVAETLSGAHLVAANPGFDGPHLDSLLRQHGEILAADYHHTDIGSLVRGWAHGSFAHAEVPWPLKLHDAARLARIDPDQYETHTALGDARLLRDVFDAVTGGAG